MVPNQQLAFQGENLGASSPVEPDDGFYSEGSIKPMDAGFSIKQVGPMSLWKMAW
jgi:hypothetical protein